MLKISFIKKLQIVYCRFAHEGGIYLALFILSYFCIVWQTLKVAGTQRTFGNLQTQEKTRRRLRISFWNNTILGLESFVSFLSS